MATKRLTDLDGNLAKATVGATIVGDGSTAIPSDGFYLVKALAGSSTLPTGIEVGYLVPLTTSDTPAIGDDVAPVTFTNMCYVQNGTLDFSRDEIETTTLCDGIKTYIAGRTDLSGSFDGIFEAGNDEILDIVNRFIDTVSINAAGDTATVSAQNGDIFYLQFEVNKTSTQDEPTQFYFLPITILTTSNGLSQGSAQTFSASIRVTDDGVNNINPAFYNQAVV